ncbi:MAG: hypothetical protein M1820_010240 [Bogoriella megaspora]|nr:MAG: hypothetical protein M1820_010240 [Bogoriella megaspora]
MLTAVAGDADGIKTNTATAIIIFGTFISLKFIKLYWDSATWTVVAAWTCWSTSGLYRKGRNDPTIITDVLTATIVELWTSRIDLSHLELRCTARSCRDPITWEVLALLVVCAILAGIGVRRENLQQKLAKKAKSQMENSDENLLKPMILPCRTNHTRLFPKKHSFSYSYLFVGIPVGWRGCTWSALSVDTQILSPNERKRGWFHISGADYLDRDNPGLDLKAKLAFYLQSQDENPGDYPHAYLVTAPKFMGYSFNPVSFWYLYSDLHHLKAMILEVNNTFDERRMYFLKRSDANGGPRKGRVDGPTERIETTGKQLPDDLLTDSKSALFSESWVKDFHVSPFNDRTGSYTLAAHDPCARNGDLKWHVDNNVVLKTADDRTKLVAQVFSDGNAVDPQTCDSFTFFKFIVGWWWVGFVTFPRILREAYLLYFKRQLSLWFRPEVDRRSIGRTSTASERTLEIFFQHYLEFLTKHAKTPVSITYQPPSGMSLKHIFKNSQRDHDARLQSSDLHVLTPAFFSRFVHYAHSSEAFDMEFFCTDELNRTIWVSNPKLMSSLFEDEKKASATNRNPSPRHRQNLLEALRWKVLNLLRCPPAEQSYPANRGAEDPRVQVKDIRSTPFSGLDRYVWEHSVDSRIYRRTVTKLFLAQRFALGLEAIVGFWDLVTRIGLTLLVLYLQKDSGSNTDCAANGSLPKNAMIGVLQIILINAVHVWALAKGF